jgi:hypothetical protein
MSRCPESTTRPIANDDALIVTNALPGAGNVIANDADPDLGESSSLTVVEVNGSAANVGSEITLPQWSTPHRRIRRLGEL